ncbi:predicted protein [Naegleria gruberi]|uniref:NAD(+) ADP-ribosyltransferase n=1 Tax=Naegleria gruberi TaxID=5762 RepID=D2VR81_NAEGR|nr:uncharacterized protein NAEGRDRAFT_51615 [Naegleria gruberi]EFC40626.1 predicted protein [Naegleria gruberi]|eukprot:XP_002673370.1 predicted protein [Naegleria gruberi strain NEG-M]
MSMMKRVNNFSSTIHPIRSFSSSVKNFTNTAGRYCKLIMVSSKNNNKYYEMTEKDGEIHIVYGRVGATGIAIKASLSEWDSLVRSKMKKGYVDMTNLGSDMTNAGDDIYLENSSPDVKSLISELNNFSNISIVSNYNVGVGSVTKEQLDSAQSILDELYKVNENFKNDEDFLNSFNEKLLKLYAVIPRKMKKVQDYLINDKSNKDSAASLLDDQQEILDVMATQVKITKHDQSDQPDFLKKNGLVVEDASQDEIKLLKKMMGSDSHLFYRAFRVTNNQTQTLFDNFVQRKRNQKRELFWHGSKNANFLSIMINGLQLRPAANGRMFGHGNYFEQEEIQVQLTIITRTTHTITQRQHITRDKSVIHLHLLTAVQIT